MKIKNKSLSLLFSLIFFGTACGGVAEISSLKVNQNLQKSPIILNGAWTLSRAFCPDGSKIVFQKTTGKPGRGDLVYNFDNETSGSISIMQDSAIETDGNSIFNSPYGNGLFSDIPIGVKTIKTKINTVLTYSSENQVSLNTDSSLAESTTELGEICPSPTAANEPQVRAKYLFSGIPDINDNILKIEGTFSADLINCDATTESKVNPIRFDFRR